MYKLEIYITSNFMEKTQTQLINTFLFKTKKEAQGYLKEYKEGSEFGEVTGTITKLEKDD